MCVEESPAFVTRERSSAGLCPHSRKRCQPAPLSSVRWSLVGPSALSFFLPIHPSAAAQFDTGGGALGPCLSLLPLRVLALLSLAPVRSAEHSARCLILCALLARMGIRTDWRSLVKPHALVLQCFHSPLG